MTDSFEKKVTLWLPLLIQVFVGVVVVSVGWAVISNKVDNVTKETEKKVDKVVFDLHLKDDQERFNLMQAQVRDSVDTLTSRFQALEKIVQDGRDARIALQTDTGYIRKGVDDVKLKIERLDEKIQAHIGKETSVK